MAKINRSNKSYKNQGFQFEVVIANRFNLRRDGRNGHTDLLDEQGRRIECKFFQLKDATAKSNAVYGIAHGFVANKEEPLDEQLRRYCRKFDRLCIGMGADAETAEIVWLTRKEAFEWLRLRYSYKKDSDEIRFCHGGTCAPGRVAQRMRKLEEAGYII